MKSRSLSLKISATIGAVSAECIVPKKSKCIMTFAHGAGAGMHHSFMVTLAQLLSEQAIATLRFNFPFTENKKGLILPLWLIKLLKQPLKKRRNYSLNFRFLLPENPLADE